MTHDASTVGAPYSAGPPTPGRAGIDLTISARRPAIAAQPLQFHALQHVASSPVTITQYARSTTSARRLRPRAPRGRPPSLPMTTRRTASQSAQYSADAALPDKGRADHRRRLEHLPTRRKGPQLR